MSEITKSDEIIQAAKESEENNPKTFMEPQVRTTKKKPGRPPKDKIKSTDKIDESIKTQSSEPVNPKFNIPTKALCYPIVRGISTLSAQYVGDRRAAMIPDEVESMTDAFAMVIDKYMPDAMSKYGPEIYLASNLAMYGSRLLALKKLIEQEQKMRMQSQQPQSPNLNLENTVNLK